jgi:tetratricopeptide (TPR) repeat protein
MSHADIRAMIDADPKAGIAAANDMLLRNPNDWRAKLTLARGLRAIGDDDQAERHERELLVIASKERKHRSAAQALGSGRSFEANTILKDLLDDDPDDALASIMLGIQASRAGEIGLADRLLGHAVTLVPGDPGARLAFADHLRRTKRFANALRQLDHLSPTDRETEMARGLRAECLGELGRDSEQLDLLRDLAAQSSNPAPHQMRIALTLRSLGRQAESSSTLRDLLRRAPFDGTVWYNLANLKTETFSDADVEAMNAGLARAVGSLDQSIRLNFALGVAHESRREWKRAFEHFERGNLLRDRKSMLKREALPTWVAMNENLFTSKFFADRQGGGDPSNDPIFIVGMQRSGSTLLEQILSSHPQIEGTAELREFPSIVRTISERAAAANLPFSDYVLSLDGDALRELGATYIADTRDYRISDAPHFIDKLPNNWSNVALIALTLPNARIIDVRRDPLDCCFSNWKQLYAAGLEHTNRFETMAEYYTEYVRLMRHMKRVLPCRVHQLIYEDLVADTERSIRKVFEYLGLDYDPSVLEFHRANRAVRTISAAQVRQPINTKGIGAAAPYAEWIGPLRDALGKIIADWRE